MQKATEQNLFGADISEFQTITDAEALAKEVDFLYMRASTSRFGYFVEDRKFLLHAAEAESVGIPVGAYHYALPSRDIGDAARQAEAFYNRLMMAFSGTGDLLPGVDVEQPLDKSISARQIVNWVIAFRDAFEYRAGRKLMLYTGSFFIDLYDDFLVDGVHPLVSMPLWIAMYPALPSNPEFPRDAGGWNSWRVWQFSDSGRLDGISYPVDLNYGPKTLAELRG